VTPAEFREARRKLGLTLSETASILGVEARTVRKWEAGSGTNARPPNPTAARAMQWMLDGFRPPQWPSRS
jgi:DNA-binding transcriptional regulator YiaG